MIYLIEYDRASGTLVHMREFDAADQALAEDTRLEKELELLKDHIPREIVLLEASSEDELRKTHRRYFEKIEQLISRGATSTNTG